ncbi:MAG TPA: fibronectin type III domain-containing protein [Chthoniobacteraceae bacterium]|nr:fibronectin type III domain-containing protein [Chthoniobacteraceae bacterium]
MTIIPQSKGGLVILATRIHAGLVSSGAEAGLTHNNAAAFATDLYAVTGPPGAAEQGAFARYDAAKAATALTHDASQLAIDLGRKFAYKALGLLKHSLGTRWNSQWTAVGFINGSLAVPRNPLALLVSMRAYFRANPTKESVEFNVSAAEAEARMNAITAGRNGVDAARAAQSAASATSANAMKALRNRASAVRKELALLLDDNDELWYRFGFPRPIDGHIPAPVSGLALRAVVAGEIIVEWERSALAASYRVSRQIQGVDLEPITLDSVNDPLTIIRDLPSGATVIVYVIARNASGETQPVSETIGVL